MTEHLTSPGRTGRSGTTSSSSRYPARSRPSRCCATGHYQAFCFQADKITVTVVSRHPPSGMSRFEQVTDLEPYRRMACRHERAGRSRPQASPAVLTAKSQSAAVVPAADPPDSWLCRGVDGLRDREARDRQTSDHPFHVCVTDAINSTIQC